MTTTFPTSNSISKIVKSQFPAFYNEHGQDFIEFVEIYYRWLEQSNNVVAQTRNLFSTRDIDQTANTFIDYFKDKYFYNIPTNIVGDKRFLQKHILDLYRSKGSIEGVKLLFRLLYNQQINLYKPSEDLLRPSDGQWIEKTYIEVSDTPLNSQYNDQLIIGETSGATGFVQTYEQTLIQDKKINIFYISNIDGTFLVGERLTYAGLVETPSVYTTYYPASFSSDNWSYSNTSLAVGSIVLDGFTVAKDGSKLFLTQSTPNITNGIISYAMSTPWNISTATLSSNLDVTPTIGTTGGVTSIHFNNEGTKMFFTVDDSSDNRVYNYNLNTPWDLATAANNTSFSIHSQVPAPVALMFNNNGNELYVANSSGVIFQYHLAVSWDIETAIYGGINKDVSADASSPKDMAITTDGTILYVLKHTSPARLVKYNMSSPWNISTAVYEQSLDLSSVITQGRGLHISFSQKAAFVADASNDTVKRYNFSNTSITTSVPQLKPKILGSPVSLVVTSSNPGNQIGDSLLPYQNSGAGEQLEALANSTITVGSSNGFIAFSIIDGGSGYTATPNVSVTTGTNTSGVGATFTGVTLSNTYTFTYSNTAISYAPYGGVAQGFDGNTSVSNTDDFISFTSCQFANGDFVTYTTATGNTAISGLTNAASYWIVSANSTGTKLSATYDGSAINLTSGVSETGHFLTGQNVTDKILNIASYGSSLNNANLSSVINTAITFANLTIGTIVGLTGVNPGTGYNGNVNVHVTEPIVAIHNLFDANSNIIGNNAVLSSNVTVGTGLINTLRLTNSGFGYYIEDENIMLYNATTGNTSQTTYANVVLGGVGTQKGYWNTTRSFASADKYIHDNDYYQEYSYEIQINKVLSKYFSILKKVIHPAGNKIFGKFVSDITTNQLTITSDQYNSGLNNSPLFATLDLNFIKDQYFSTTGYTNTVSSFITAHSGTFTRSGNGWYFNANGDLTVASTNTPRVDHYITTGARRGLLLENASTNLVRNNSYISGANGSPGTAATNHYFDSTPSGLTRTLTYGTEYGMEYVDIQYSGTTSGAESIRIAPDALTTAGSGIVGIQNDIWVSSAYIRIANGAITNLSAIYFELQERNSAGTLLTGTETDIKSSLSNTVQRFAQTRTFTDATAAICQPGIRLTTSGAVAIDITLRVYGWQAEKTISVPTSLIKTTTTSVTRNLERLSIPANGSAWFTNASMTIMMQTTPTNPSLGPYFTQFRNAGLSRQVRPTTNTTGFGTISIQGGGDTFSAGTVNPIIGNTTNIVGMGIATDNCSIVINGNTVALDTTVDPPLLTELADLYIGTRGTGTNALAGWYERLVYIPYRLTDAEIRRFSALM